MEIGENSGTIGIMFLYTENYFVTWSCIRLCLISNLLTQHIETTYVTKSLTMFYVIDWALSVCREKASKKM